MDIDWERIEGSSFPLGVTWLPEQQAFNFAIYSKHAESIELRFYGADAFEHPLHVYRFDYLRNKAGPIWHCRLSDRALEGCRFYGYRISGPGPGAGYAWHTFDAEKLLLDPYAKAVFFPDSFDREAARLPGSNEGRAPLCVLPREPCPFDWSGDRKVRHTSELVIYELHVKGFTAHSSSGVSLDQRGSFDGVIAKIPYLQQLGVTAVELMPVFQFDPQEGNYWGYMPLNFLRRTTLTRKIPPPADNMMIFVNWSNDSTKRISR